MQTLTQPTLLLKPFAESGDKNTIPTTNTDVSNPQRADLTNGFPSITSETPDNGGLPPERKDLNGLGYLTTTYDFFYQAGGQYTFNSTISTAIGGYPQGARLWYTDSNGNTVVVRSLIQNNTYDFVSNPSYIDGTKWAIDIPSLASNNVWTGSATFSGAVSISGNITSSGTNSFSGQNTFTGTTLLKNPYLSKIDSNLSGGCVNFDSADGEVNTGKTVSIYRYNGAIKFSGYNSSNNYIEPLNVDIQNNRVYTSELNLPARDSDKNGGIVIFNSAPNEVNYPYDLWITRNDGKLFFSGLDSSGVSKTPLYIDVQNDTVWFSANSQAYINRQSMPNYNAGVSQTNDVDYTASSNGWLYWGVNISNNASAILTVNGIAMTITAGSPTGLQPLQGLMIPVSAGVTYKGTNLNVLTFYPCIGG